MNILINSFLIQEYISENLSTGVLCLVFMKPEYSADQWSQISNVYVKYKSFAIDNTIRKENSPCSSDRYMYPQNVELILICQGKKGIR